jgi:hypothetical protein
MLFERFNSQAARAANFHGMGECATFPGSESGGEFARAGGRTQVEGWKFDEERLDFRAKVTDNLE